MPEEPEWNSEQEKSYKTPSCKGFLLSSERGQDALACARCHNVRGLIYLNKVSCLDTEASLDIFGKLLNSFPFIEHVRISCGNIDTVIYPRRPYYGEPDMLASKIRAVFRVWKELKIASKQIGRHQVYNRAGYSPVILPDDDTTHYDVFGGDDGVELSKDGKQLRVIDLDKAFKSGKHMYVINWHQSMLLYGQRRPDEIWYDNFH